MNAGRELDALVAEKVMEANVYPDGGGYHDKMERVGNGASRPLPRYSTDIATAWEVVRTVRAKVGAYVQVEDGHPLGGAFARFVKKGEAMVDRPTQTWESAAATTPLAICLAALKAVEVR